VTIRSATTVPAVAAAALAAAALTGCGIQVGDPGPQTRQERDIADVTAVQLNTSGNLFVTEGESPSLTITAGEDVIDRLTSDVDGGTLELGADGTIGSMGEIRYELVVPRLEAVELSGSGDVGIEDVPAESLELVVDGSGDVTGGGVDVEELVVRISGSGTIDLEGRAGRQDVEISGSGDYLAADLDSSAARVNVEGSGTADVTVSDELDASVSGSGDITYGGDPSVSSDVDGSGDVSAR
jgi:Putative auto-transporter adhesin, head GIN domain